MDTIRRAHAVHPITAYQLEWSLWSRDVEENIIPTCRYISNDTFLAIGFMKIIIFVLIHPVLVSLFLITMVHTPGIDYGYRMESRKCTSGEFIKGQSLSSM